MPTPSELHISLDSVYTPAEEVWTLPKTAAGGETSSLKNGDSSAGNGAKPTSSTAEASENKENNHNFSP